MPLLNVNKQRTPLRDPVPDSGHAQQHINRFDQSNDSAVVPGVPEPKLNSAGSVKGCLKAKHTHYTNNMGATLFAAIKSRLLRAAMGHSHPIALAQNTPMVQHLLNPQCDYIQALPGITYLTPTYITVICTKWRC